MHNQLLVSMTVPLIYIKQFGFFRVTSFPNKLYDDLYSFILPNYEYVALDKLREKYIPFTNPELENCYDLQMDGKSSSLVCLQILPLLHIQEDRDLCYINLLTRDTVSKNCNLRLSNISSEIWI